MADYSTTMGILQPQVGKSGDILLKFEHKNGGERGIRTLGDLRLGGFQDRCLKPLDHLSGLANYLVMPLSISSVTFFTNAAVSFIGLPSERSA